MKKLLASLLIPTLLVPAAAGVALPAGAQEFTPAPAQAAQDEAQEQGLSADAQDDPDNGAPATAPEASSSIRTEAPNTDGCPQALTPPAPVDTSEQVAPQQASPTPLPPTPTDNCGLSLPEGFEVNPAVVAGAWMITDIDSGEIVAMKDPHGRYRPASIIKALLALVAIRDLDLRQKVTATAEDASQEGSLVGVGEGGVYTVEQLLQGLIMGSGNDAAHALATVLGGDEVTLRKVNELAHELGTTDTYAASYSGLDAPGMSTSAWDLSLIYQAAFKNTTFARLAATETVEFPGYGDVPGYELGNDNGLFMNDPDGIGGKTGYTDDAHHTFVGALDRKGRRLMAVILDTTVEHGPRAWQQAQALLHEAYDARSGVGQLTALGLAAASDAASPSSGASASPAPATTTSAAAGSASSLEKIEPWLSWVVVGAIGLLLILVASVSLLRPRRGGRGRRAGRSQG